MNSFCTIITSDYFFYAQAIYDSLRKFHPDVIFNVLVVNENKEPLEYKSMKIYFIDDIRESFPSDYNSVKKYENDENSVLRWALKPLFLKYLLIQQNFEKVIFVDPDLFFYENPSFLFDKLNKKDVIITPHWRAKDPKLDASNFDTLFTGGIFNAGFFGCNKNSINVLDWWLEVCAYKMEKKKGFYVDQIYLNLMPIYFTSQVEIIQHKGCNVSNWNMIECERTKSNNGVKINYEYPIVFIHFTNVTINNIAIGADKILSPFLDIYRKALIVHNSDFKFNNEVLKNKVVKEKKSILKKILHKFNG